MPNLIWWIRRNWTAQGRALEWEIRRLENRRLWHEALMAVIENRRSA